MARPWRDLRLARDCAKATRMLHLVSGQVGELNRPTGNIRGQQAALAAAISPLMGSRSPSSSVNPTLWAER